MNPFSEHCNIAPHFDGWMVKVWVYDFETPRIKSWARDHGLSFKQCHVKNEIRSTQADGWALWFSSEPDAMLFYLTFK